MALTAIKNVQFIGLHDFYVVNLESSQKITKHYPKKFKGVSSAFRVRTLFDTKMTPGLTVLTLQLIDASLSHL